MGCCGGDLILNVRLLTGGKDESGMAHMHSSIPSQALRASASFFRLRTEKQQRRNENHESDESLEWQERPHHQAICANLGFICVSEFLPNLASEVPFADLKRKVRNATEKVLSRTFMF